MKPRDDMWLMFAEGGERWIYRARNADSVTEALLRAGAAAS